MNLKYVRENNKIYAIKKLGGKCVRCGAQENLTFDHIKNERRGDTKRLISQLISGDRGRLDKELELCQLLCRRCHGLKTFNDDGHDWNVIFRVKPKPRHGTMSSYNNGGCRCDCCKEAWATYVRNRRSGKIK